MTLDEFVDALEKGSVIIPGRCNGKTLMMMQALERAPYLVMPRHVRETEQRRCSDQFETLLYSLKAKEIYDAEHKKDPSGERDGVGDEHAGQRHDLLYYIGPLPNEL